MARRAWPFRAPKGRSGAGRRRVLAPAWAVLSLACLVPAFWASLPAAAEEGGERFSFTGTFRYEPLPAGGISALHLPPEAVPLPIRSRSRRDAMAPMPLPPIVPRALLGSNAHSPDEPFATDDRSTLGVSEPVARETPGPATRSGAGGADEIGRTRASRGTQDRESDRVPDAADLRDHERSAPPASGAAGSRTSLASDRETAGPARPRGGTSTPTSSRRQASSRGTPAAKPNPILAPTPSWAERAFQGLR